MANFKLACVVLMCIVLLYAQNGYAVTCGEVVNNIIPCITYLQIGNSVTANCCNGVKAIFHAAVRSITDLRTTCYCLKSAAQNLRGSIKQNNAASLPSKCGVNVPYKIGPSIDCASIK